MLIVDDEADVRDFAANFFQKRKIDCTTAASGEEAISIVEKDAPDLVLLDIKMEGIDGIETLRRLKKIAEGLKVIMVTGTKPETEGNLDTCLKLGAIAYIHKPLELDELEKVVLEQLFQPKK